MAPSARSAAARRARRAFRLAPAALALAALSACAPASPVLDLEGRAVDPLALKQGELAALVFVDPACPLSNKLAPELARIAEEFAGRPVRLRLVYPDPSLDAAAVRAHLSAFHLPADALLDPGQA